jgi:hypothetical protein
MFCALSSSLMMSCSSAQYARTYAPQEPIVESLFAEKDRTISEENIQKLLDGKLTLPPTLRVALYRHGDSRRTTAGRYYHYQYDDDVLQTQQTFTDTLMLGIKRCEKVVKTTVIPELMLQRAPTVTQLRESAVRLQSDLLLVYTVKSDIYYHEKWFAKDQVKAYSTMEIMLLDVRTGLIPFSSIISNDYLYQKPFHNMPLQEARKLAEMQAILLNIKEAGKRVSAFLANPN